MILPSNQRHGQQVKITHMQSPTQPSSTSSSSSSSSCSSSSASCHGLLLPAGSPHFVRAPVWRVRVAQSPQDLWGFKSLCWGGAAQNQGALHREKFTFQLPHSIESSNQQQRWQLKHSSRPTCTWLSSPPRNSLTSGNILTLTVSAGGAGRLQNIITRGSV